jgi:hypothetical protein
MDVLWSSRSAYELCPGVTAFALLMIRPSSPTSCVPAVPFTATWPPSIVVGKREGLRFQLAGSKPP